MAQGSKEKYSDQQKRKAEHVEKGYEEKGVSKGRAEAIAWATVNKQSGGGERGGSGESKSSSAKKSSRKNSAKKAAQTRHRNDQPVSLQDQTKETLLKKAREKNISGRSTMNKHELVLALQRA